MVIDDLEILLEAVPLESEVPDGRAPASDEDHATDHFWNRSATLECLRREAEDLLKSVEATAPVRE